ncbi:hypothetical protein D3C76_1610640 [compost metagenome]
MLVSATAADNELAAKVLGIDPSGIAAARSERMIRPAIGKSLPMPLPKVSMSGFTPECSTAHILPVRPAPDCTSSTISSAPLRSQALRNSCRNSGEGGT